MSTSALEELTERLDMTGTEVEAVHTIGEALSGVVVGRILTKERHPDAEKLWVTTVDVGAGEPLTIVCGAQNFEAGDKVPVALVGTTLPNGATIKKAKLRGVVSEGMNCSAAELGFGDGRLRAAHTAGRRAGRDGVRRVPRARGHRARARDHAEPPGLPFGGRGRA